MKRPLIAIIGNRFYAYQKPIIRLLSQRLAEAGYGTVYICGGPLKPSPDWNKHASLSRSHIYELARQIDVSGYVIVTSVVGHYATAQKLDAFAHRFTHKPLVCLGPITPTFASVTIDNYVGMRELMEHMTLDSGRRRFVFIRGFPDNPDSLLREQAFRDVLAEKSIPIDEQLMINGNFIAEDAFYAMDSLLTKTRDIDAVVSANDTMAQGAIHALLRQHISVPSDIIVSGFDDSHEASTCLPPLTTVHSSLKMKVEKCIESLKDQITEGVRPDRPRRAIILPTRLVVRASTDMELQPRSTHLDKTEAFDAIEFKRSLSHNLASLRAPTELSQQDVVNDIVAMLVNGTEHRGSCFESALQQLHQRPEELYWWRHLQHQISSMLPRYGSRGLAPNAVAVTSQVLSQIHETIWSVESASQVAASHYYEGVRYHRAILSQVNDFHSLCTQLQVISEFYKSRHVFACVYEHPGDIPDENARVFFQYPDNCLGPDSESYYPSKDILPNGFMYSEFDGPLVVEPLCAGHTHLGYVVLDVSNDQHPDKTNPAAIADIIASALWRCLSSI